MNIYLFKGIERLDIREIMRPHWAEELANKVIEKYKPPFVVSGGMTTSGPTHFGTVCEFLFPGIIKKILEKKGHKTKYYFIADIMDAFDSVPRSMEGYTNELSPHLGKPLYVVPDPTGKSKSFGDHYLDEAKGIMNDMGLTIDIIRINEYYEQGKFDYYAELFFKNFNRVKEIVEETSGRQLGKDWSMIMPICEKCGKIATTRVTGYKEGEYTYVCDRDVKYTKGCGFEGKNKIKDHKYKILWRLHWPAWHHLLKTNIEGAGIDHHTKGGSYDTLKAIYKEIFKEEPPIAYRFGFILFEGKKYSKSKGTGMGVKEIGKFIPPQMIQYILLKPDLTENIDIAPKNESLLRLYDEFERIGKLKSPEGLTRDEEKKYLAYEISGEGLKWKAGFVDVLLAYQVYKNWEKVKEIVGDPEGVEYLKGYLENWEKEEYIPEQYRFDYTSKKSTDKEVNEFLNGLDEGLEADGIHQAVFEFAKGNNIPPKEIFKKLYLALIGKEKGPRIGKLIYSLGVKRIKEDLL